MPRPISEAELQAAIAELDNVREAWLQRPGVSGVDVGFKFKNGLMTDELAIRVHVRRKLPADQLSEQELFPSQLGRFSVDIIESTPGPEALDEVRRHGES